MLDSEPQDAVTEEKPVEAIEPEVTPAPEVPEADAPEELVITIAGEEPEPDEDAEAEAELGDKGKRALQRAREAQKEAARKLRETEARMAELEARTKPPEQELKRPTLEECGFNEDTYAVRVGEYLAAKAEKDAKQAQIDAEAKADEERYKAKLDSYHANRAKVGVDEDVQARVVAHLSPAQQSILMDACADPAKVVAALASAPKTLAALAGEKKLHRFAYELAKVEGKIQMTAKTPPPPESKLRGGGVAGDAVSTVPLDKLRDRAQASGDYTEYLREKARRAAAGVKS